MSKKTTKITINRVVKLEESWSWLSHYTEERYGQHFITDENGSIQFEESIALKKLGKINEAREKLLKEILNKPH